MHINTFLSLSAIISGVFASPLQTRDSDFLSVRRKLHKDFSTRAHDPAGKYFHESWFDSHYDGRFASHALDYTEQKRALKNLIQTFLATFSDLGVETWLMHGTLLGWWWGKKVMPWDSDLDVQVSESSIFFLAAYYNMSIFHYRTPRIPEGRDYLLEINPHYANREQTDRLNVIDGRWIDTESGLYIDITTVRYNLTHPAGKGMLSCKDGHEFRDTYLYPLRDTYFEGTPAKIPFRFKDMLESEYGSSALTTTEFQDHVFSDERMEWIPKTNEEPAVVPPPANKVTRVHAGLNFKHAATASPEEASPEELKRDT